MLKSKKVKAIDAPTFNMNIIIVEKFDKNI